MERFGTKQLPDSTTSRSREEMHVEENPAYIKDPKQRKKIQNRIAQRTYRKRIKSRMEALENFREATAAQMLLSEMNSPVSTTLKEANGPYFNLQCPLSFTAISTPDLRQAYNEQQERSNPSTPMSPTSQIHSERTSAPVSPSLGKGLAFKPHQISMWDLNQGLPLDLGLPNIQDNQDSQYSAHETQVPSSHPLKEFIWDGCPHDEISDGKTSLHVAAEKGKTSTVQLLLTLRPNILAQDAMGRTALHLAVYKQHQGVIDELLKNMDCLEVQDWNGQTALHAAAANGFELATASLLVAGADTERKDSKGQTAFHLAAANGRDKILQLLFNRGADINAKIKLP